jgi:hypothetical protein
MDESARVAGRKFAHLIDEGEEEGEGRDTSVEVPEAIGEEALDIDLALEMDLEGLDDEADLLVDEDEDDEDSMEQNKAKEEEVIGRGGTGNGGIGGVPSPRRMKSLLTLQPGSFGRLVAWRKLADALGLSEAPVRRTFPRQARPLSSSLIRIN